MVSRFILIFAVLATLTGCSVVAQEGADMGLEQSVCGLKEPFVFWLWSSMAGSPDATRLADLQNVEDISFTTRDRRTLRGYKLRAGGSEGQPVPPAGYLLVMQGNAILADQVLGEFAAFAAAGYDVYLYDFRGYGRSEGRRRLKAIISDYTEIIAALNAAGYERRLVYAMSFGGIAFLNGYASHGRLDRVIIDSTPSRLSDYGCPRAYDPVEHLPDDCSRLHFVVGLKDGVVTPAMSRELVETAQRRGAAVTRDAGFAHPFMDYDRSAHRRRMDLVVEFLTGD